MEKLYNPKIDKLVKKLYKAELQTIVYLNLSLYIFFPWAVAGDLCSYRSEPLLMPFVFSLKKVKIYWLLVILIILLAIGMPLSHLFLKSIII